MSKPKVVETNEDKEQDGSDDDALGDAFSFEPPEEPHRHPLTED
ncbi:hypothetical protein EXIGUO8H_120009 [Exiguobacterium sp. 8H]|nr:hypothetical protein EXIGUO8H_120009 [Exiguobacterium sp. 8H]